MNAVAPTVVEILERGHRHPVALRLGALPQTIGRANSADCVLTDPAVAGEHLRIDSTTDDGLTAEVLDTGNGVWLGRRHLPRGTRFTWPPGEHLRLGHTVLSYRRAEDALPPEQPLKAEHGWPSWGLTLLAVALLAALSAWLQWSSTEEAGAWLREWPQTLLSLLGVAAVWALVWALLGRLLTGQLGYWVHWRIAVWGMVAYLLVQMLADALGFMFSLAMLPRFAEEYLLLILGGCLWFHLRVATPVAPRVLVAVMTALTLSALGVQLGLQWQANKRLGSGLFMSSVMPPNWRLAPTREINTFVDQSADLLEKRLARRLQEDEEASIEPEEEEAEE